MIKYMMANAAAIVSNAAPPVLLAAWFGILTGLGEASLIAVRKLLLPNSGHLGNFTFLSRHVAWMAPVAELLIFMVPGIVLSLTTYRWRKLVSPRITVSVFSFFTFLGLLLLIYSLSVYAKVALAAGLAVQTSGFLAKHLTSFNALVRRTLVWMVALVGLLAAGTHLWILAAERAALASLPPALPSPNVLLIVMDTVCARNLSLYGYERPTTPQLQRIAKAGVVFESAISTAPWTLPSHASMFTGRYPHELSTSWRTPLDSEYPTLAEVLSSHGYVSGGFAANVAYCTYESGLARGFAHYEGLPVSWEEVLWSSTFVRSITSSNLYLRVTGKYQTLGRKTAAEVSHQFLHWLSGNPGRPYFAFLNYFDAHFPYLAPEPFDGRFGSPNASRKPIRLTSQRRVARWEVQGAIDAYDASISYIDYELGLLFDELRRRGVLDNTLVIITSDHGEEFGEHGFLHHGSSVYLPSVHVPLIVIFPSHVPANKTVREFVTLRDIPSTILDLLNLKDKASFPGASLARYWEHQANGNIMNADPLVSEVAFSPDAPVWSHAAKGEVRSLIVGKYRYIHNSDGSEETYNIEDDPGEQNDLVNSVQGRQMLNLCRQSLVAILGPTQPRDNQ
jgi:arylsulfatase A-like enzyme